MSYRAPPTAGDKAASFALLQLAKQIAKSYGIPPDFIAKKANPLAFLALLLKPTVMGCGSLDCNNDGIIDDQFLDVLKEFNDLNNFSPCD